MRLLPLILLALPFSAFAGAKGSSHKKDAKLGATYWSAAAAIDGKLETAWQVPGEAGNEGQWIEIVLPASGTIDKVVVYPGFGKDAETFAKYAYTWDVKNRLSRFEENDKDRQRNGYEFESGLRYLKEDMRFTKQEPMFEMVRQRSLYSDMGEQLLAEQET